jgi:hypothetical protein
LILLGVLLVAAAQFFWAVDIDRGLGAYVGVTTGLGALGRPRPLFEMLRSVGWFAIIESDLVIRVILGVASLLGFYIAFGTS